MPKLCVVGFLDSPKSKRDQRTRSSAGLGKPGGWIPDQNRVRGRGGVLALPKDEQRIRPASLVSEHADGHAAAFAQVFVQGHESAVIFGAAREVLFISRLCPDVGRSKHPRNEPFRHERARIIGDEPRKGKHQQRQGHDLGQSP